MYTAIAKKEYTLCGQICSFIHVQVRIKLSLAVPPIKYWLFNITFA